MLDATEDAGPADDRPVVLYDADCGLCRWSLARLLARDRERRLRPVALQSQEAVQLLSGMSAQERMASAHLYVRPGEVHTGGAAATEVLRRLPGGGPLAALLGAAPSVTERVYRLVADHRMRLGPLVTRGAAARARRRIAEREARAARASRAT